MEGARRDRRGVGQPVHRARLRRAERARRLSPHHPGRDSAVAVRRSVLRMPRRSNPMTADVALPRAVTVIARGMSIVAGLLLLGVILLTVADVVSRNARDRSIVGTVDIATMLLVAIDCLGLASAEADGRHVV